MLRFLHIVIDTSIDLQYFNDITLKIHIDTDDLIEVKPVTYDENTFSQSENTFSQSETHSLLEGQFVSF